MLSERQDLGIPRAYSARLFSTCPVTHRLVSISSDKCASGLSVVLCFTSLIFYLCKLDFFSVRFDCT